MDINKIYQGDCLEIMKIFPSKSIDCVITDPPYEFISKNPTGGGFMKKENKRHLEKIRDSFGMSFRPEAFLEEIKRVLKKFNAYIFTNKSLLAFYINFAEKNKYKWDLLIWHKPNAVPVNNGHYLIDKEYIIYIKESGACFHSNLGYKRYFTIKEFPIGNKKTTHPAEKPEYLFSDIIEISTNPNDIILDPFLGSGTIAVVVKKLGRNYIGIELDKSYIDMANKRLAQENLF